MKPAEKNSPPRRKSVVRRSGSGSLKSGAATKKPRLHLRKGKALGKEHLSLARLLLETAIQKLHGNNASPESVHLARTTIKKVRTIIQLASPAIKNLEREKILKLLHEASLRLGPLRDSEVKVQTLDLILESEDLLADDYYSLREGLADIAKQIRKNGIRQIPLVIEGFKKAISLIKSWKLDSLDGRDVRRRVRRIYRRGRTTLELSLQTDDPDIFHTFRKLVKQLFYSLRITSRHWPEEGVKLILDLEEIGELAGRERDYRILADTLRSGSKSKASANLIERIEKQLPNLRHSTLRKSAAFYEKKPKSFIEPLTI
jgi:hypothetical protein